MKPKSKRSAGSGDADTGDADVRPFEEVFAELEQIVEELESGALPLEKSLERFEVALADYRRCLHILEGVEQRIEILTSDKGERSLFAGYEQSGAEARAEDEQD